MLDISLRFRDNARVMKKDSVIFTRRSIRAYDSSKKVSRGQLEDIIDAAMHAPTAMNTQPWEFLVADDAESVAKILKAHPYCESLKDARSAVIVCANLDREFKTPCGGYAHFDCSAATENLLLRASELGLGTCWCGIAPEKERMDAIRKAFGMPSNIEPMALVIVGYPAESPKLDVPRYDAGKLHFNHW